MPHYSRASIRYARALLTAVDEAGEPGLIATIEGEVSALRGLIDESPQLAALLEDPTVSVNDKRRALEELFKGKLSPLMWRLIELLVQKRRENLLGGILETAAALLDERAGRVQADVASAVPLEADQQKRLRDHLAALTGKTVTLSLREDPSLVAGFVARVGDTVYDASLSAQLARLRRRLLGTDIEAAAHSRES